MSCLLILGIALVIFIRLYLRASVKAETYRAELDDIREKIDHKVKERTRQLELSRDSMSEYAVQKFELAQELELRNHQIMKQKDDLLKQAEKLRKAYEEIKKLDSFKHQMTRMIIHDLKNPLSVVLNVVETMDIPEKPAGIIKQISYEMLDLVMNILDVNKFEDSKMKIRYDEIDLTIPVKRLIEKFSFLSRNSSIDLRVSIPEPCMIHADLHIIERVLENLMSNSMKFTPPGGYIQISAIDQNEKMRIEVRDNGNGIPNDLINQIFDEYVNNTDNAVVYTNSTGIGLTYCKLAVEAQGGEIGLMSKKGEGTTVWFMVQKGSGQGTGPDRKPGEFVSSGGRKLALVKSETDLIRPFLEELKGKGIFEISEILKILRNDAFNNSENLMSWKDSVESAVFSANIKQFRELTDI